MKRTLLLISTLSLGVALVAACSSGDDTAPDDGDDSQRDSGGSGGTSGSTGLGSGSGSGSGGVTSGGGGTVSSGGAGPILDFPAGGEGPGWLVEPPDDLVFDYDPSLDADPEECVAIQVEPQPVLLDMFLVLDRSGSMDAPFAEDSGLGDCNVGQAKASRWCNAVNAIHGFAADSSSVNMGFAYADFAFSPCEGFDMELPFDYIEAADANGHVAALGAALNAASPGSGTNTAGAVHTLIAQTAAHQPLPHRRTIGILITDGEPYLQPEPPQFAWQEQACEVESATVSAHLTDLNEELADHFDATGIPTFIMGMDGVDAAPLELLASGAGAPAHSSHCISGSSCHYYSVGSGQAAVFLAALESIRRSVVGCEFALPDSQVGLTDLGSLEVLFTPDSGDVALTLTQRVSEAACGGGSDYWLDLTSSTPVVKLCPATCALRGESPTIDISVSCEGS